MISKKVLNLFLALALAFPISFGYRNAWSQVSENDMEARIISEIANETGEKPVTSKGILSEVPDGLSTKDISFHCDPRRFEDKVVGTGLSTTQYFKLAKQYFAACSNELTLKSSRGLLALLKFTQFTYPFFSHPQVKSFMVPLPNGSKIPGILALKKDPRPRPLVIVRCGVFCSADQSASTKSYLMHLFDQSPFNVLILANQTGMDYIYHNQKVTLGGWAEGFESLEVGRWMQEKWEHRERISSLHFMGISLGGNAAVYGAHFNDTYPLANGRKIFNSVTAICPVISLKPTLDELFKGAIVGRVFFKFAKDHFVEARHYVTDVPDLLSEGRVPTNKSQMTDYLGELASTSLQRRGIASTPQTYFRSNNFWNLKQEVKTPMMVWASKDDMVVSNRLNSQVMEFDDVYERSENVGVINLAYGNHCGFSSVYGFQASAALLRTFVMNNSPEFVNSYNVKQEMPWTFGFSKVGKYLEHVGQKWEFSAGSDKVKVTFRLFDWGPTQCFSKGPWEGEEQCIRRKTVVVPVSALTKMGGRVPKNTTEAQAISREFNTKVEFVHQGKSIKGTNASDFSMTWRQHFE